jgi:effector-binding domain-containing protein
MDLTVTQTDLAEQPIISIRGTCRSTEFPGVISRSLGELFSWLGSHGIAPAGHPFVLYHTFDPEALDAEVCVPVERPVEGTERIQARILPPTHAVSTIHVGPYETIGETYTALMAWARTNEVTIGGPMKEIYLNGPGEAASPAEYRTEIQMPAAVAASAAAA